MKYRRETKHIPSQSDKGFTECLAPEPKRGFLRYRPDFTGPATNFNEIGGWRMAMDKDLRNFR